MPIIDGWEPIAIGLVVTECVPIRRSGRIWWKSPSGTKGVNYCKIPSGWSGNIIGAAHPATGSKVGDARKSPRADLQGAARDGAIDRRVCRRLDGEGGV